MQKLLINSHNKYYRRGDERGKGTGEGVGRGGGHGCFTRANGDLRIYVNAPNRT